MKAQILATFLGTEKVPSADGTSVYHRVAILQGLKSHTFTVDAETYKSVTARNLPAGTEITVDIEIVLGREKTFLRFLDLN